MTGRIIKVIADLYGVVDEKTQKRYNVKPLGVFRHKAIEPKVGDLVEFTSDNITKVLPRKNDLIRPVIANVDQAIVAVSLKQPDLNLNLLDRFLCILAFNDIEPIIVLTKKDLLSEDELVYIETIKKYYQSIGYQVFLTSKFEQIEEKLKDLLAGKLSVITGDSGSGKSSLIQVLDPKIVLKTNEISKALNRGKHTTRHTEIHPVCGGYLADTPGFGNLSLADMEPIDIAHSMVEFFNASSKCKYNGCLHDKEPLCEVKKQVELGNILKSRYDNYLLFIEEVRKNKKW